MACRPEPTGTAGSWPILEAVAAPLNARYGYASPELERTLERSIELAQSLGRKDALLSGLVALNTAQFVQGRTADSFRTAAGP